MNTLRSFTKKTLVAATASVVMGLGVAGNASAASYAIAYDNIWNWNINSGFPGFNNVLYTSEAHADLNSTVISDSRSGSTTPQNVPIQFLGQGTGDNAFTPIGRASPNYGLGDAVIWNPTNATNIGESYVTGLGTGSGGGLNTLNGTFTLLNPTTLTFSFNAHPYIEVEATGNTLLDFARADINFNISLVDAQGNIVFAWSPDGAAGGITGGVENLDPFDLSVDRFANSVVHGPLVYDPTGLGIGAVGIINPICNVNACTFSATTFQFGPGNYSLAVSMEENVNTSVPEPATLLLLGGGLMGMAFATRRRTAAKA